MLRPGDVCRYTGFEGSKLRYWRGKLRPLRNKAGNRRSYLPSEVVALLVLDHLVTQIGCDIEKLAPLAGAIFDACAGTQDWLQLEHCALVIQPSKTAAHLVLLNDGYFPQDLEFLLILALAPFVQALRSHLLDLQPQRHSGVSVLKRNRSSTIGRQQKHITAKKL